MEPSYKALTPGLANLLLLGILFGGGLFAMAGPITAGLVNQMLFAGTALLVAVFGEWSIRKTYRVRWPGLRTLLLAAIIGPLATIASGAISVYLHQWLTYSVGPLPVASGLEESPWAMIILAVLIAPFAEEFFFRGYLQRAYEKAWPQRGWILAGILFGVIHGGAGAVRILTAPIIGLVYAWLFWRTKSIWPGVVTHLTGNLVAVFLVNPAHTLLLAETTTNWLPLVAGVGGLLTLALLWVVHGSASNFEEEEIEVPNLEQGADHPAWRIIAAGLVILLLLGNVSLEMKIRRGDIVLPAQILAQGTLTLTDYNLEGTEILGEFSTIDGGSLTLSYFVMAENAALELVNPHGVATPITYPWPFGETEHQINTPGTWQIVLRGSGKVTSVSGSWTLRERR